MFFEVSHVVQVRRLWRLLKKIPVDKAEVPQCRAARSGVVFSCRL